MVVYCCFKSYKISVKHSPQEAGQHNWIILHSTLESSSMAYFMGKVDLLGQMVLFTKATSNMVIFSSASNAIFNLIFF